MEKEFFDVFPNLKVNDQLQEWLEMVTVSRVACNPAKTRLWVYIHSERWIHKKYIMALENQIERQFFAGLEMQVTVIERFHLSKQYSPANFLDVYRSSMEIELKNYNMLEYNLFKRSQISFPSDEQMDLTLPDSVISREKSEILVEYLQKVFCERCGMNLKINLQFVEAEESKYRKNAALQIRQEVANVLKHAKLTWKRCRKKDGRGRRSPKGQPKKQRQKLNQTRSRKLLKRKVRVGISMAASAGTAIRTWFMEEILRVIRSIWNP